MTTRVLFVCAGNICRSPTAEAVFRAFVRSAGLSDLIQAGSAGTNGYHIGSKADSRAMQAAARRRYDLSAHRARKVEDEDFNSFDLIVAMDTRNMSYLRENCPLPQQHKLMMMMAYAPKAPHREVPDPYYGGTPGFELVLDLLEESAEGLLGEMRQSLGC